ncbi:unnamed protein product [Ranitomeya imitator]|uniref:EF-hand domain-containing protein n=1 Tax=Ranitomeya imitator TaxID=111125 RepID=A0ABN9MNK5_9NEOB|nr:unnamed protein product [Ranitomeya imitator]
MSCYWGGNRTSSNRHDPSLPYLEQYRIDLDQFQELFSQLTPWSFGPHTSILASRIFRLQDTNKDSLINFKEFVTGLALGAEETESALEATNFFTEDVTPEVLNFRAFTLGYDSQGNNAKQRVLSKDHKNSDGQGNGSAAENTEPQDKKEEKTMSAPDYKYYLRMWANEKEQKKETIKDIPKMNQEQFIELCKTFYNMFSEDPVEQELYHAIATVASLLLRIGEVGKKFSNPPLRNAEDGKTNITREPSSEEEEEQSPGLEPRTTKEEQSTEPIPVPGNSRSAITQDDIQKLKKGVGNGERNSPPTQPTSDDETKDDTSVSSYSMVSASSLQCEDIADDTVLVGCEPGNVTPKYGSTIDAEWSISFEQILASMLTEQALVSYFEKKVDIAQKIKQKKVERQISSSSEHELSSVSG